MQVSLRPLHLGVLIASRKPTNRLLQVERRRPRTRHTHDPSISRSSDGSRICPQQHFEQLKVSGQGVVARYCGVVVPLLKRDGTVDPAHSLTRRGDPGCDVGVEWQLFESGPADAEHTVLLLPGGMCSARSCHSGVPTWVVHAEKGDGGLTGAERRTLEACSTVKIVTIPGSVFFLPNEVPDQIASVINDAVAAVNA